MEIDWLRSKIDDLDVQILELISKRAELAVEIGKQKKAKGLPVFPPSGKKSFCLSSRRGTAAPWMMKPSKGCTNKS